VPQENVEKLRRGYEAFNRGEFDAAIASFHPNVEVFPPGDQAPYRGADKLRAWMEPDAFETQVIEPQEFTVAGNRILVEIDVHARGAGSGIELDLRMWNVWTFDEDGLATRVETFLEHEESKAREAAGLRV
jgi:ketosteroid isomerase-like protein